MLHSRARRFPHRRLLKWFRTHKRVLPWREDPSPYKVWISEIMLQQTQVRTVLPYYERFLKRFPDLKSLARAGETDVVRAWSGLGYYSRARNLLRAAKTVVEKYGGMLPGRREDLIRLPGIGAYTAGAILSIAYHRPVPILDGNVRRVMSRVFLVRSDAEVWELSRSSVLAAWKRGKADPSDFNQALMELGALVCAPKEPRCGDCPLHDSCLARKKGLQFFYPPPRKRPATLEKRFVMAILWDGASRFLLRRRSVNEKWLKGMWELPTVEIPTQGSKDERRSVMKSLSVRIQENLGGSFGVRLNKYLGFFSHSITRHRLKVHVFEGRSLGLPKNCRWISMDEAGAVPSSSMLRKALHLNPAIQLGNPG